MDPNYAEIQDTGKFHTNPKKQLICFSEAVSEDKRKKDNKYHNFLRY